MDIKFNKVDDLNATIKVSLVKDDYQPHVDKTLKDYRKKAALPGFREAPRREDRIFRQQRRAKKYQAANFGGNVFLESFLWYARGFLLSTKKIRF